jgi:hypothetical protein
MMTSIKLFVLKYKKRTLSEQIENLIAHDSMNVKVNDLIDEYEVVSEKIIKIEDKLDNT